MKKLLLKLTLAMAFGLILIAQLNYEQALGKAQEVDTDGEIQAVLDAHGFRVDLWDDISMVDKLSAVIITLSSDETN
jgi:hypothetical protein